MVRVGSLDSGSSGCMDTRLHLGVCLDSGLSGVWIGDLY